MSRIAVIGDRERVRSFAFAGVHTSAVEDADATRAAWHALPADVALLILTPAAHLALQDELDGRAAPLFVVMP